MSIASERWGVRPLFPFETGGRRFALVVESAALAELDDAGWALADFLAARKRTTGLEVLGALGPRVGEDAVRVGLGEMARLGVLVPDDLPILPPEARVTVRPGFGSLTLHVAHDCNLRCGYCYAEYGRYGGEAGMMSPETAVALVDRLFDDAGDRKTVHVTFFGGEPLLNMPTVRAAAAHAQSRAAESGRELRMGLTTNGTLLTDEIAAWLREKRITISVSLDGPADVNDRLRPYADGKGSYAAVVEAVRTTGVRCVARVTLTRRATDVARIVRHLVGAGFREVGVAPVATGDPRWDLGPADLEKVMTGYRALAKDFVDAALAGESFAFSNLRSIVEQIHAGDARPMPCGAGLELAAASMDGEMYACHRMLGQEGWKTGALATGIDEPARWKFLTDNHPKTRAPCGTCWARYLCGGGCHHMAHVMSPKDAPNELPEVFCDFLRDQFRLGLEVYVEIATKAPEWLERLEPKSNGCNQPVGF